ncbi:MAG: hypothetical protein KY455_08385 [Euryarchaeota archaeon]|nr:hypothetical protein [Euryarchaeota archaeon]
MLRPGLTRARVLRGLIAALLLTTTLAMPSASAQSYTFETLDVRMTPANFTIELERTEVSGTDAANARWDMDNVYGNEDGIVSPAEVASYAAAWRDDLNDQIRQFENFAPWGRIQVDGRPASEVRITDVRITGAEGTTDDTDAYTVDFSAYMAFPETTKERVEVRFAQEFVLPRLFYETAHFAAAEPWHIDPKGGETTYWTGEGYSFPFEDVDDFSSGSDPHRFNLTTEEVATEEKKKDSPALPAAMVVLALAALVLMTRRRR